MKGFLTFLVIAFLFWWVVIDGGEVMSERDWIIAGGLCVVMLIVSFTDLLLKHGRAR